VLEDRYELIIILHIPLIRDGIVNILPWSVRVHGRGGSGYGLDCFTCKMVHAVGLLP
jgi:hypothetical protein